MNYRGYTIHKTTSGYAAGFRGLFSQPFTSLAALKAFLRERDARPLEDREAFT